MPRGGARPGAGRKPGQTTKLNDEARRKALAGGISPLDYLLQVMRDEEAEAKRRDWAAAAAAPYVHARRASVDEPPPPPPEEDGLTPHERARRVAFMLVEGARESAKAVQPAKRKAPEKKPA